LNTAWGGTLLGSVAVAGSAQGRSPISGPGGGFNLSRVFRHEFRSRVGLAGGSVKGAWGEPALILEDIVRVLHHSAVPRGGGPAGRVSSVVAWLGSALVLAGALVHGTPGRPQVVRGKAPWAHGRPDWYILQPASGSNKPHYKVNNAFLLQAPETLLNL